MKKNKNHIGIDISKLSFDVAIKNENDKYLHFSLAMIAKVLQNL